jgi:rhodanese-related sulfurtransferase
MLPLNFFHQYLRRSFGQFAALSSLFFLCAAPQAQAAPSWFQVNAYIAVRHPFVKSINTAALSDMMAKQREDSNANAFLLLDIREEAEYAVSRLPGAKHVKPDQITAYAKSQLELLPKTTPIVVYCAVGARSAIAAQALADLGFTNVLNVKGSIFAWANEGRPLEGGARVHPYDAHWGALLKRELHAEIAATK